jgi:uncharacterized membrane protein
MVVVVCAPTRWFDVLPDETVNANFVSLATRQLAIADDAPAASAPARNNVNTAVLPMTREGPAPRDFIKYNDPVTALGGGDNRLKVAVLVLAVASAFCGALTVARALYSHRGYYVFMGWNLVLAWVPLLLSLLLARRAALGRRSPAVTFSVGAVWLLFFPNAPYMVTDLIHLRARNPVPVWYDAIMVFAFGLVGLCLAFLSLWLVHGLVARRRGAAAGWLFVAGVAGLSGFGVYLGRFQRWNSWDVVARPGELLADLVDRFMNPLSHPRTVGLTFLMAALFAVTYVMLFVLTSLGSPSAAPAPPPTAGSQP